MPVALRVWLSPGALLILLLLGSVQASEPAIAIALDYQAPADCPDGTAVANEITRRSQRIVIVAPPQSQVAFEVSVEHLETGFSGQMRVLSEDGRQSVRQVRDKSCAAVVSALSFMVALTVDPRARIGLNPPPVESKPPRPDMVTKGKDSPPPKAVARASRWHVSASGFARTDLWRGAAIGAGISLSWARLSRSQAATWSPTVGLLLAHAPHTTVDAVAVGATGSRARLDWIGGAVWACGSQMGRKPLSLRGPCLGLTTGALHGQGRAVEQPRDATRLSLSLDATLQMSIDLGTLAFIRVAGGGAIPLVRHQFVFRSPDVLVSQTPRFGAVAVVDVGVKF